MKKGVISIISALAGAGAGAAISMATVGKSTNKALVEKQKLSDKHLTLFLLMNQWVKVKQEGKNLSTYFEMKGYKKIAIYGMSYAGETLLNELKGTNIEVAYGIDKNANGIYSDVEMLSMEDTLEEVDAIIVTPITFFDSIEQALAEKIDCPIISLEDILYEV